MQINGYSAYFNFGDYGTGSSFSTSLGSSGQDSALQVSVRNRDTSGISDTFAQDIVSRIQATSTQSTDSDTTDVESTADSSANITELQESLSRAMDYMRENFGDTAAQAAMGLVYKAVGNGEVTEDNLGNGLLQAIKFVDKNFGFAAGDQVISFFNSDLNKSINEYFDNGMMEVFYASSPGSTSAQGQVMDQTLSSLASEFGEEAANTLMELFTKALEQGSGPYDSLRNAVDGTASHLARQYGGEASQYATMLSGTVSSLLQGGEFPGTTAYSQIGTQLDLQV